MNDTLKDRRCTDKINRPISCVQTVMYFVGGAYLVSENDKFNGYNGNSIVLMETIMVCTGM